MSTNHCTEVEGQLGLYVQGDCDETTSASIAVHLAECESCRSAWREAKELSSLLDAHFREEARIAGVMGAIAPRRSWRSGLVAVAAAAAAIVAVVYLAGFRHPPDRPAGFPFHVAWASDDARWRRDLEGRVILLSGEARVVLAPSDGPVLCSQSSVAAGSEATEFFIRVDSQGDDEMSVSRGSVFVTVLSGLVLLTNPHGEVAGTGGEVLAAEPSSPPRVQVENLAKRFARFHSPVKTTHEIKVPAYDLPLDFAKVVNYAGVAKTLKLPAEFKPLAENGFVVIPGTNNEDVVSPYQHLQKLNVPIFVTTDTVLHLYHVQFDETLREIEERAFYPDVLALTRALIDRVEKSKLPDTDVFRDVRGKALTYLAIGLKCLQPDAAIPSGADAREVERVLSKMEKHEGFWPAPETAERDWPLFRYAEDFSQYVPRGHYTRSDELKRYFRAMMWYGRLTFLLKGDAEHGYREEPALVASNEADLQTIAACLLTDSIQSARLADGRSGREVWERIYSVTSFYVGLADDLGFPEYASALAQVSGKAVDLGALADAKKLRELRLELAKHPAPAIYSGTGGQMVNGASPDKLLAGLHKTTGFRLMGQRFVPDSHVMGKLVYPTVGKATDDLDAFTHFGGKRVFPRGLDVMTVLGSKRAREITAELGDDRYLHQDDALSYDEALDAVKKDYAGLDDMDWNRNLYWSWLHALKPLVADFGPGYPTFMTTKAYRTKSLNTALASWAQLRHDTILYAKQPVTLSEGGGAPKPVQGYVEPIPEFYARMLALSRMTTRGLDDMKVLTADSKKRLGQFEMLLAKLLAISEKELANQELEDEDYTFIREIGDHLEMIVAAPNAARLKALREAHEKAKDLATMEKLSEQISLETEPKLKTTVIADVHTDQNTRRVLEVGTGYVELGLFVYRQPDGRLVIGAGPVLSFYEFKHPMEDRLTDEKWRDILKGKNAPAQPEWTKSYRSTAARFEHVSKR